MSQLVGREKSAADNSSSGTTPHETLESIQLPTDISYPSLISSNTSYSHAFLSDSQISSFNCRALEILTDKTPNWFGYSVTPPLHQASMFYYVDGFKQMHGPVPVSSLSHAYKRGILTRQSPCYRVRFFVGNILEIPTAMIAEIDSHNAHSVWKRVGEIDWTIFRQTCTAMPSHSQEYLYNSPPPPPPTNVNDSQDDLLEQENISRREGSQTCAELLTQLQQQCRLFTIPTALVTSCLGIYLSDLEANHLARSCRRSHSELQSYRFKQQVSASRMASMSTSTVRCPAAFGRISHVGISTASEWAEYLPKLPGHVRSVTIEVRKLDEFGYLYPPTTEAEKKQFAGCCGLFLPPIPASAHVCSPVLLRLPSTVEELYIKTAEPPIQREIARWLDHLEINTKESKLRIVHFDEYTMGWTTLPKFIRDGLPDCLQELRLPISFCTHKRSQPAAEYYPMRWPASLTKLRMVCSAGSPFASGLLPPLPPSLIELKGFHDTRELTLPQVLAELPPSITSLHWTHSPPLHIDHSWTFPRDLKQLSIDNRVFVDQISCSPSSSSSSLLSSPSPCRFPSTLLELHILRFAQPELISSVLPDSITKLTIGFDGKHLERPFEGMQWPSALRTLHFPNWSATTGLRSWTPPPHLTELNLGDCLISLEGLPLPPTLRTIHFGIMNDFSLSYVYFPPALEHIIFNHRSMPYLNLEHWNPPTSLLSITVTNFRRYQQLDMEVPPSLKRFSTSRDFGAFEFSMQRLGAVLPPDLEELNLQGLPVAHLPWSSFRFPPKLRCLRITSNYLNHCALSHLPTASQLPPTLREFWVLGTLGNTRARELAWWAKQTLPPDCVFCARKVADKPLTL